jgi:hypothetical protein
MFCPSLLIDLSTVSMKATMDGFSMLFNPFIGCTLEEGYAIKMAQVQRVPLSARPSTAPAPFTAGVKRSNANQPSR